LVPKQKTHGEGIAGPKRRAKDAAIGMPSKPIAASSGRRRYLPFRAAHTIQSQPFILPFNIEASKEYPWLKTISGVQCTFRCRRF